MSIRCGTCTRSGHSHMHAHTVHAVICMLYLSLTLRSKQLQQKMTESEVAALPQGQQVQDGGQPAQDGAQQDQQPAQRGWGNMFRSFLFQMVVFYFITSYFRGSKTPEVTEGPDGEPLPLAGINLFMKGQELVSECLVLL